MKNTNFKNSSKAFIGKSLYMLPSVIISIFIMLTISIFFGKNNAFLGILFLFYNVMSMRRTFSTTGYMKDSVIFILMTVLGTIADINIYTSILLNLIIPFLLVILFSDELSPTNYFIYGLFFTLMQINYPITLDILPSRILATLYGLLILLLFNLVMQKFRKKEKYIPIIKNGFETLVKKINLILDNKLEESNSIEISTLTTKLNEFLYIDITSKSETLTESNQLYFQFSLLLENIDKILNKISSDNTTLNSTALNNTVLSDNDKNYLKELSNILNLTIDNLTNSNTEKLTSTIIDFLNNNSYADLIINNDFKYVLSKLLNIFQNYNLKNKISISEALHLKFIKIKRSFDLDSCYFRFAIKISLTLSIGFAISHFIPFANAYWLPITAFAIMRPYYEDTKTRIYYNFFGVLLGALLFLLIFRHIPSAFQLIFMIIIFCTLFSINNEILRSSIGCQLALVLSITDLSTTEFTEMRILMVLLAITITWLIDKFILNTKNFDGIKNNINGILYKDRMIIKELRKTISIGYNSKYLETLLLESYVLQNRILEKINIVKPNNIDNIKIFLNNNTEYILETEKLISIFNNYNLTPNIREIAYETLNEMEKMLINLQTININFAYPIKYDEDYIKSNLLSCKKKIKNINKALSHTEN